MNKKLLSSLFIISLISSQTVLAQDSNIVEVNSSQYTQYSSKGSEYYNKGMNLMKASQYTGAITQFRCALKENPNDKSSRIQLVNAYIARAQYHNNKEMDYNKTANDLRSALFYLRFYNNEPVDARYLSDVNNLEATLDNILYSMNADKTAKGRLTMGLSLRTQGEFAAAATEFQKSLLVDSTCKKEALANLGEIYYLLNLNEQAVLYIQQAIILDENNTSLSLKLATAYERLGKIDLAAEQYNMALAQSSKNPEVLIELENIWRQKITANPNDAEAYANLGTIYQKRNDFNAALAQYEKAESINPSNINTRLNMGTLFQAKKEYETAIAAYDTIIDVNPNFKLAYLYKAQCYRALGNKEAAMQNYKLALNLDPNNQEIKNELFSLQEQDMTTEQKLAIWNAQIQQDSSNAELIYKYAYELHKSGKLADAVSYYNQVIKLDTQNQDAYINLAQAYKQQQSYDKAKETLFTAKKLFPNNTTIKNQISSLNSEMASILYTNASTMYQEKKYMDAIATYKKIEPITPESLLGIGACYQAMNNFTEAAKYYAKSLEKDPNNAETAYYTALAYSNAEDFTNAKIYAKRTLVIQPDNKDAKELIKYVIEQENTAKMDKAIEFFEKGDYAQAINLLNSVIAQDNTDSNAYYYRAMIYDNQKKYQLAINDYKKAILHNSQMLIAYYAIAVDYDYLGQYSNALTYHKKYLAETKKIGETNDYTRYSATRIQDLKDYESKSATNN